ncbi:MAG: tetratricopeptide repeat protein [Hyphomonadaceae bacterium]
MRAGAAALALCAAASCVSVAPPPPRQSESYADFLIARVANMRGDHRAASDRYSSALAGGAARDASVIQGALIASLAIGDADRARALARQGAQQEPVAYAHIVRGAEALSDGRWRQAREQFERVDGDASERLTARMLLTWALTGEGQPGDSDVDLGRLLNVRPYGALFAYQQALSLDYGGRTEEALAAYAAAADGGLWMPPAVERHADLLARLGRRDEAIALLTTGPQQTPNIALEAALARYQATQQVAQAALTPARGAAIGLNGLAIVFLQERDTTRALVTLTLALMLDPELDAARINYADAQMDLDHYDEAEAALGRIGADSPYGQSARAMEAWLLIDRGREEEALAMARASAESGAPRALRALGDIYRRLERYEEADAVYTRLLETSPDDWRLLFARGAAREQLSRHAEAESDLQRALEVSPDQPDVLNYLGYMWVDRGERLEEALAMIMRAVELRPLSGAIIDSLGWAYFRMGQYEQALIFLERAVELEPADPTLNDHLGDVYWRLDRRTEARFQWRRALTLEPADAGAIEAKLEDGLPPTRSATR